MLFVCSKGDNAVRIEQMNKQAEDGRTMIGESGGGHLSVCIYFFLLLHFPTEH